MIYYIGTVAFGLLALAPVVLALYSEYRNWRWQRKMRRQWEQEVWENRFQQSLNQMRTLH